MGGSGKRLYTDTTAPSCWAQWVNGPSSTPMSDSAGLSCSSVPQGGWTNYCLYRLPCPQGRGRGQLEQLLGMCKQCRLYIALHTEPVRNHAGGAGQLGLTRPLGDSNIKLDGDGRGRQRRQCRNTGHKFRRRQHQGNQGAKQTQHKYFKVHTSEREVCFVCLEVIRKHIMKNLQ